MPCSPMPGLLSGLHVLIADPSGETALTTAAVLRSSRHHFHLVENGPAIVDQVFQLHPDVVLIQRSGDAVDPDQIAELLHESCHGDPPLLIAVCPTCAQEHPRSDETRIDLHLRQPLNCQHLLTILDCYEQLRGVWV